MDSTDPTKKRRVNGKERLTFKVPSRNVGKGWPFKHGTAFEMKIPTEEWATKITKESDLPVVVLIMGFHVICLLHGELPENEKRDFFPLTPMLNVPCSEGWTQERENTSDMETMCKTITEIASIRKQQIEDVETLPLGRGLGVWHCPEYCHSGIVVLEIRHCHQYRRYRNGMCSSEVVIKHSRSSYLLAKETRAAELRGYENNVALKIGDSVSKLCHTDRPKIETGRYSVQPATTDLSWNNGCPRIAVLAAVNDLHFEVFGKHVPGCVSVPPSGNLPHTTPSKKIKLLLWLFEQLIHLTEKGLILLDGGIGDSADAAFASFKSQYRRWECLSEVLCLSSDSESDSEKPRKHPKKVIVEDLLWLSSDSDCKSPDVGDKKKRATAAEKPVVDNNVPENASIPNSEPDLSGYSTGELVAEIASRNNDGNTLGEANSNLLVAALYAKLANDKASSL